MQDMKGGQIAFEKIVYAILALLLIIAAVYFFKEFLIGKFLK